MLNYDNWGNFFEQLSLFSGALIVYASTIKNDVERVSSIAWAGYIFFGVCIVSFALDQLFFLSRTAGFVPKWIPPDQMFWVVLTIIASALAAVSILSARLALLASRLLVLMLIIFGLLVCLPGPLTNPHSLFNWAANTENLAIAGAALIVSDLFSPSKAPDIKSYLNKLYGLIK